VPCHTLLAPVRLARGASPEAAARATRYAALQGALRPGEWLLLAQHQEDQAETLLLQLLRGAGVAGLAAMPARAGVLLRPLLDVPRAQLLAYLRRRAIAWTDDPSNTDERYDRNYLRLRVLPLLRARWPASGVTLGRTAALAAEAQVLLSEAADVQLGPARDGPALRVTVLRRLGAPQRRNALRRWLDVQGIAMPDQRRLQEISGPLLRARHDAQPRVRWSGGEVRRHGDRLYAAAEPALPPLPGRASPDRLGAQTWAWRRVRRLVLPGGTWLELSPARHGGLLASALPDQLQVAYRSLDGRVAGRPGGQRLKRLLQSLKVPPWKRGAVPLIYAGRRLIAVGDHWQVPDVNAGVAAAAGGRNARRLRLRWGSRGAEA
jgi:tRNA(Ile)-lysidine synthase